MKSVYRRGARRYFADWLKLTACETLLLAIGIGAVIFSGGSLKGVAALMAAFAALYLVHIRFLPLYIKAARDVGKNALRRETVSVSDIELDRRYCFMTGGGGNAGTARYRLTGGDGGVFLLAAANKRDVFQGFRYPPDFSAEIEYLESSRIVVGIRFVKKRRDQREYIKQGENMRRFQEHFSSYFL